MGFFGVLFGALTQRSRWMQRAAGVSTMRLICHEDTWIALERLPAGAFTEHHLNSISATPERIAERGEGMLEISLSGSEVTRLLRVTHFNKKHSSSTEHRALGDRTYRAFGAVLDTMRPNAESATEIPRVVLDDRPHEPP